MHAYLAFPDFIDEFKTELELLGHSPRDFEVHGDLIIVPSEKLENPVWARNVWASVERISFQSISEAIRKLKALGLRWALHSHLHHRRAKLISDGLNTPRFAPLRFPTDPMPTRKLGAWMLTTENEIVASAHCTQTIPDGDLLFEEDRTTAPTRAYLKLWEAFTRLAKAPQKGGHCIDLGSCPGGWTWVIASLGAEVLSVDRSEIDPKIEAMPNVNFIQGNAFTLDPKRFERMDWVFSDVICAPPKLLELVHAWLKVHPNAHFVCTIKFKGETDHPTMAEFLRIPGSFITHLTHNKHEVTWFRIL